MKLDSVFINGSFSSDVEVPDSAVTVYITLDELHSILSLRYSKSIGSVLISTRSADELFEDEGPTGSSAFNVSILT